MCVYPECRNALFSGSLHLWSGRQQLFLVVCCNITQESTGWCCFPSSLHGWLFSNLLRKDDKPVQPYEHGHSFTLFLKEVSKTVLGNSLKHNNKNYCIREELFKLCPGTVSAWNTSFRNKHYSAEPGLFLSGAQNNGRWDVRSWLVLC